MYGQTEATARMSYLPPERSLDKIGSVELPYREVSFILFVKMEKELKELGSRRTSIRRRKCIHGLCNYPE